MANLCSRRRFLRSSLAAGFGLLVAACGDEGGDAVAPPAPSAPDAGETTGEPDLPPSGSAALREIFDPRFEPLGQRVARAGLYDLADGFERSATGDHLAIYVEPIDPAGEGWDDERYLETAVPGMAVTAPYAFERWSGLNSVDVCQEPPQEENASREPPIVTQLLVSRAVSATLDWESAELADLVAAEEESPDEVTVRVHDRLADHPVWVEAEAAAGGG